jgi:glycosyltransferase involved in cell wall biosynthesis
MRKAPVTVIIPAYNAARFLSETIHSASAAGPEKIIVIDDGSTDSTLQIALDLKKVIEGLEVHTKSNGGESSAINFGLGMNKSKYVLFLSADDLISEKLLSLASEVLDENPSVNVAYPSWNKIDSSGKVLGQVTDIDFSYERLIGNLECLPGPGSVIRSSALTLGRLESMSQMGDFEQWIRLASTGSFKHLEGVLASWRQHETNMSFKSFGSRNSMELDIVNSSVDATLSKLSLKNEEHIRNLYRASWHKLKAIAEVRVPGSLKSIKHVFESLRIISSNRLIKLKKPWTIVEVVGCLLPNLSRLWIRFTMSPPLRPASSADLAGNKK